MSQNKCLLRKACKGVSASLLWAEAELICQFMYMVEYFAASTIHLSMYPCQSKLRGCDAFLSSHVLEFGHQLNILLKVALLETWHVSASHLEFQNNIMAFWKGSPHKILLPAAVVSCTSKEPDSLKITDSLCFLHSIARLRFPTCVCHRCWDLQALRCCQSGSPCPAVSRWQCRSRAPSTGVSNPSVDQRPNVSDKLARFVATRQSTDPGNWKPLNLNHSSLLGSTFWGMEATQKLWHLLQNGKERSASGM